MGALELLLTTVVKVPATIVELAELPELVVENLAAFAGILHGAVRSMSVSLHDILPVAN